MRLLARPSILIACLAAASLAQPLEDPVLRTPSIPDSELLHKVEPEYPAAAVKRRIQGVVRFSAIIGTDGRVSQLRLLSGHPLLVPAARRAARQWIYVPKLLNGRPARVITSVRIPFTLDAYGRPFSVPSPPLGKRISRFH
jgi:TonB family protein